MAGWHHQLNGHEFEQTLRDREGQGGLTCCSPWGCKELDTTERLNNNIILHATFLSSLLLEAWGESTAALLSAGSQPSFQIKLVEVKGLDMPSNQTPSPTCLFPPKPGLPS